MLRSFIDQLVAKWSSPGFTAAWHFPRYSVAALILFRDMEISRGNLHKSELATPPAQDCHAQVSCRPPRPSMHDRHDRPGRLSYLRRKAMVAHQFYGILLLLWLSSIHFTDDFMDRHVDPKCSILLRHLFRVLHAYDGHSGNKAGRAHQASVSPT